MTEAGSNKIIVALDFTARAEALRLVNQLSDNVSFFKVGLQLYTAAGPALVREILATGARVFLDLKLHDIPNTVARAVESAGTLGVQMLTIHLSGGKEMVRGAVTAAADSLAVAGVTVLTSATQETLDDTGIDGKVSDQVLRLARLGVECGVKTLVASPHEIKILRAEFGDKIKIVTPGIRPKGDDAGDQKRFMTPAEAVGAGADYLVIGRPITANKNPPAAVKKILDEMVD